MSNRGCDAHATRADARSPAAGAKEAGPRDCERAPPVGGRPRGLGLSFGLLSLATLLISATVPLVSGLLRLLTLQLTGGPTVRAFARVPALVVDIARCLVLYFVWTSARLVVRASSALTLLAAAATAWVCAGCALRLLRLADAAWTRRRWANADASRTPRAGRRVAIIGGGIAGVGCAYALGMQEGTHVHVFEKAATLGGNAKTQLWPDGLRTGLSVLAWPRAYFHTYRRLLSTLRVKSQAVRLPFHIRTPGGDWAHGAETATLWLRFQRDGDVARWNELCALVRRCNALAAGRLDDSGSCSLYDVSAASPFNFLSLRFCCWAAGLSDEFWRSLVVTVRVAEPRRGFLIRGKEPEGSLCLLALARPQNAVMCTPHHFQKRTASPGNGGHPTAPRPNPERGRGHYRHPRCRCTHPPS